ncbi:NADPH-dependent FMN reductase [Inquilinus sp. NPDC058860]|uniref:NADPH-dependent FMN reductase n=1 Tax=Inquilinus sp. NPDC058860 TaxID=3346652 RepID=UPI0036CDD838
MIRLGIVVGSTRPGRRAPLVARWVAEAAGRHAAVGSGEAGVQIIDIADHALPLLDEPVPAIRGDYRHLHTKVWAAAIGACDGFIFVTPEYNHSFPAALKNAIDFLHREWTDKAAGFVGYGALGAARAVEQLRPVLAEVKVATVRTQVLLSKYTDRELFTDPETWSPSAEQEAVLATMLGEVIAWSKALRTVRVGAAA